MTDRPIIFSAPMVSALLDGRKSQTRRLLKPQPKPFRSAGPFYRPFPVQSPRLHQCLLGDYVHTTVEVPFAPGDRLWVKETWACHWATDDQKPSDIDPALWSVRYFADDHVRPAARVATLAPLEQCNATAVAPSHPGDETAYRDGQTCRVLPDGDQS